MVEDTYKLGTITTEEEHFVVQLPAGTQPIKLNNRADAEIIATVPELLNQTMDPHCFWPSFATHLEFVCNTISRLGLNDQLPGVLSRFKWAIKQMKETPKSSSQSLENHRAVMRNPRATLEFPFRNHGFISSTNLPKVTYLNDSDIAILQKVLPEFKPEAKNLNLSKLEGILLSQFRRQANELPDMSMSQVISLLRYELEVQKPDKFAATNPFVAFYSWQSDSPNNANRGLIRASLDIAAEELTTAHTIETRIDQDTSGLPGSPDVFNSIIKKIRNSDAFICDVSIVARYKSPQADAEAAERIMVNPNVLIELGYALSELGEDRVIMVFNESFGNPKDLPFDFGYKRQLTYRADPALGADKSAARNELAGKLKTALLAIHALGPRS